jgi:hypothetical protein
MRYLILAYFLFVAGSVRADEVCQALIGSQIIAQDNNNTYLGQISDQYSSNSIFNDYGTHGSKYNSDSIWNEYGTFGSKYNSLSPFNEYSSTPPMIIKSGNIIGFLSTNTAIEPSISPNLLKALCFE